MTIMENYEEIREMLTPRHVIKASDGFRKKVHKAASRDKLRRNRLGVVWGSIGVGAVAAMLLVFLIPSGISAQDILMKSVNAMRDARHIRMEVEIRTRPMENFRYIGLEEDFVSHRIEILNTDSLMYWKIDKGGRSAIGQGEDIYTWIEALNLGWRIKGDRGDDTLGYIACLLSPQKILETELARCMEDGDTECDVSRSGKEIRLTVHAYPNGNFKNPYMLNKSIGDSENIRRYTIDEDTKRLKSASVSIVTGDTETVVLRIKSIDYAPPHNARFQMPPNIRFVDMATESPGGLSGLNAMETASAVLDAFRTWDTGIIEKVLQPGLAEAAYREKFEGATLISIGNAFISGNDSIVFVPYCLRLKDGTLQRHNLAMQRGDQGNWTVTGGL